MERRDITSLGELQQIGAGGEGVVSTHAFDASTVFKRYHAASAAPAVLQGLLRAVSDLSPDTRAYVESRCCLPTAIIEEAGKPVGTLMPIIPDTFWVEPPSGRRMLRELQHLLFDHSLAKLGETPPSADQLVELCLQWAQTMAGLHSADVIIGDVSTKNWLWTMHPSPTVYLIDCDSYRVRHSSAVLPQKQSPDWDDPRLPPGCQATLDSDAYKLALLCARVLLRDSRVRPRTAAERLRREDDPPLMWMVPLLDEAGRDSGPRPPASAWAAALFAASTGQPTRSITPQGGSAPPPGTPDQRVRPTLDLTLRKSPPAQAPAVPKKPRDRPILDLS